MIRYIAIVLAIWGAIMIVRHLRRSASSGGRPPSAEAGDTVRCAHCGLFVPRDEAVAAGDRWYCSAAHRDAARGGDG